jgi:hypothetical protein
VLTPACRLKGRIGAVSHYMLGDADVKVSTTMAEGASAGRATSQALARPSSSHRPGVPASCVWVCEAGPALVG